MQNAIVKAIVASVLLGMLVAGIGVTCALVSMPEPLNPVRRVVQDYVADKPLNAVLRAVPVVEDALMSLPELPRIAVAIVVLVMIWSLAFMLVLVPLACILSGRKSAPP